MATSSIRTRMLLLVLAVSIPLVAAVGYGIYNDMQQTIAHTKTSLRTLVVAMVSNTGGKITVARQTLERLAVRPIVRRVDPNNCDRVLDDLHALTPGYANVTYTNLDATVVCSAVPQPGGKPVNVRTAPWFQEFMKEKRFTVGQPLLGPITGKWVSVLSAPIWNERQEMVGGVQIRLDLNALDPNIPAQFLAAEGRYGFLDEDRTVVWRKTDHEGVIGTRINSEAAQRIVAVRDGEFESVGVDGLRRFYSVAPLAEAGWIAFVAVPAEQVYAPAKQRAIAAATIALAAIAVFLLLATAIARRIARPVAELKRAARAIQGGDLAVRAAVGGPSEVAEVAQAFNAMVAALQRGQAKLRESELSYSSLVNDVPDYVMRYDRQHRHIFANEGAINSAGKTRDEFIGKTHRELGFPEHLCALWEQAIERCFSSRKPQTEIFDWDSAQGAVVLEWRVIPEFRQDGSVDTVLGLSRDITESKRAEEKLKLASSVFSHAREGIMITDAAGTIIEVNDTFSQITSYSREEVVGRNASILKSGRQEQDFYVAMWRDLIDKGSWYGEIWNRRKNGQVYAEMLTISAVRDAQGDTRQYVALFSDITALKEHEGQLERIAHYDALTTLPNRVLLADRMHQAMAQAQRRGQRISVAYVDLDGFKAINDSQGHETGDQLLMTVATRMKHALREGDTLARLGGDEFVALLLDLPDVEASVPMLSRLLVAAAQPVRVGDLALSVSASIGVTFYPQTDEVEADQLLRQADQAMYQAKLAGKNRYHVFDIEQDRSIRGHHEKLERIRRALLEREFVLYYQPKVNMRTGEIIGAEALIRWQHPVTGLLLPAVFLPAIENHPLAIELGEWVIDRALTQMDIWHDAGLNIPVSVNVGASQLQQTGFVGRLRTLLAAHPRVTPDDLQLEVLETSALEDLARVSKIIEDCREIGVTFALDDFGTGYSSLTYLKRLPVSQLKIDQSFVRNMLDDPDDLAILEGVLGLSIAFRRQVIAEGVETEELGAMLLQLGCELAQGYGIARPMPADELPGWSRAWRTHASWSRLSAVSRDDLPLLFARVEHRAWIAAMELHLNGGSEAPPLDCHQCRFGKWLDSEGLARYGEEPAFQAIRPLHQQVHQLAADLCELASRGRNPEALVRVGELHELRDALLEHLKALLQESRH